MPTVGDVGTVFRAAVVDQDGAVVDVSTATSVQFRFVVAGESAVTGDGTVTDGPGGIVEYVSEAGLFDAPGTCHWQVTVTTLGGVWTSSQNTTTITPRL